MKSAFNYNSFGVKSSSDMYRNIGGIHYVQLTADPARFDDEKKEAKNLGLKTKIIKGELFIEKRHEA